MSKTCDEDCVLGVSRWFFCFVFCFFSLVQWDDSFHPIVQTQEFLILRCSSVGEFAHLFLNTQLFLTLALHRVPSPLLRHVGCWCSQTSHHRQLFKKRQNNKTQDGWVYILGRFGIVKPVLISPGGLCLKHTGVDVDFPDGVSAFSLFFPFSGWFYF